MSAEWDMSEVRAEAIEAAAAYFRGCRSEDEVDAALLRLTSTLSANERTILGAFARVMPIGAGLVRVSDIAPNQIERVAKALWEKGRQVNGVFISPAWDETHREVRKDETRELARVALDAAIVPSPAPDIADRTNLARALGLAQAIARATPYPVEMDGVCAVAGEIVTLLEGVLEELQR